MIFGHTLSNLRQMKDKRQKWLAYSLGMDPSQLSSIENGRKPPPRSDSFIEMVCQILDLSNSEKTLLINCAHADRQLGEFTEGATIDQIKLAMLFTNKLKNLTPAQLTAINAILDFEPQQWLQPTVGGRS